jgi:hypothetical protein
VKETVTHVAAESPLAALEFVGREGQSTSHMSRS